MTPKPHRTLLDRVSGYADEAAAFLRRRRQLRQPFARVYGPKGRCRALPADSESGRAMFAAAAGLIDVAGPRRPRPGTITTRLQR